MTPGGIISTVAGGAVLPIYSGDGGPAVGAGLFLPGGVAVDSAGNLYIADIGNNRIRKVNPAGVISTVAGNGTKGFSGDGGAGSAAQLNLFGSHAGLATDSAGNLYIADIANHRVRKVDSGGIITTVAGNGIAGFSGDGGPATNAGSIIRMTSPRTAPATSISLTLPTTAFARSRSAAATMPPAISSSGIVNGASFQPGIVANSWATILGTNLAAITDTWANAIVNGNLPTSLDGVTVTIGGKPAYLNYVSATQINLVVPDVPAGATAVTVKAPSGTSSTFTVTASQYGPAFFPWPNNQVVATRQDFSWRPRLHISGNSDGSRQTRRCDHPVGNRVGAHFSVRAHRRPGTREPDILDQYAARRDRQQRRGHGVRRRTRARLRRALPGGDTGAGLAGGRRLAGGGDHRRRIVARGSGAVGAAEKRGPAEEGLAGGEIGGGRR